MTEYAPIILFAYNRPEHTRRTVEALVCNELASESILYVYCDGPKAGADESSLLNIQKVRDYVHTIKGFKQIVIIEQAVNKGLDPSEIDAITEVINRHGRMISVEDDLVTNRFFLRFMNESLDFYENDKRIYQVAGFVDAIDFPTRYISKYKIFASYRTESCGWATWKDRWNKADWNDKEYDLLKNPSRRKIRRFNRGGGFLSYVISQSKWSN